MISVHHLTKRYGKFVANNDLSLDVGSGELTVLLGPNGAGKSTLIKSICGLLRFDGEVTIGGFDNRSQEAKRLLGYIPEMPALYPMLTVAEHIEFIARAYRLTGWESWGDQLLERFELDDKKEKLGKELSKGMQQKVSICCALLTKPQAVVFDEPLVGLDPHAIRELKNLIVEMKQAGCAMIISTHMIESVEENWDTTHIMKQSSIAATCKRAELASGKDLEDLYFSITEGKGDAAELASSAQSLESPEDTNEGR